MDQQECQLQQKLNHQILQHLQFLDQEQQHFNDLEQSQDTYFFQEVEHFLDQCLFLSTQSLQNMQYFHDIEHFLGRQQCLTMWQFLDKMHSDIQQMLQIRQRQYFLQVKCMWHHKQLLQALRSGPEPIHGITSPVMANILNSSTADICKSWEENSPIFDHQKDEAVNESGDVRISLQDILKIRYRLFKLKSMVTDLREKGVKLKHFLSLKSQKEDIESYLQEIQQQVQNNLQNPDPDSSQDSVGQQG